MIRFPNLGIVLPHVGRSFSVFGFEIAFYGIVLALAMIAGVFIAMHVARLTGQDPELYFDFAIWAILFSVLGARIYYVIFSWDYYSLHLKEIINLRAGGLAIYGGVIGGILTAAVWSRIKKVPLLTLLDTASCGMILGQIIGRWGNFFNREAFGGYTDNLFAMQLPAAAVRTEEITQQMREHLESVDGIPFISVHPTFLYESLWNLGVLLIMLAAVRFCRGRERGLIFWLYIFGYGLGRFWIEALRTDQLILGETGIPVSRLLAAAAVVISGAALVYLLFIKNKGRNDERRL